MNCDLDRVLSVITVRLVLRPLGTVGVEVRFDPVFGLDSDVSLLFSDPRASGPWSVYSSWLPKGAVKIDGSGVSLMIRGASSVPLGDDGGGEVEGESGGGKYGRWFDGEGCCCMVRLPRRPRGFCRRPIWPGRRRLVVTHSRPRE